MPTTTSEATRIVQISQEYLTLEKLRELFIKLDEEVGKTTTNSSLKDSLKMMRFMLDPPLPPASIWVKSMFYGIVIFHFALIFGIAIAFLLLPFMSDWYIALPLMTFVFFFATSRFECQLTNMENILRKRLGKKRIGGFVGYYMVRPIKGLLGIKN